MIEQVAALQKYINSLNFESENKRYEIQNLNYEIDKLKKQIEEIKKGEGYQMTNLRVEGLCDMMGIDTKELEKLYKTVCELYLNLGIIL